MVAQDVVRDGHQWQVGDGTSIQIWRDKWLPKSSTFQVIFMPNTLPETATVSELIDEAKGEWNVDLVKHVFLPDDAHTILGIPRSSKRNRDRMIWAYTPKGTFTVNSAYKVALSLSQSKSTEGTLDATSHSQFWQKNLGTPDSKQAENLRLESKPEYSPHQGEPLLSRSARRPYLRCMWPDCQD